MSLMSTPARVPDGTAVTGGRWLPPALVLLGIGLALNSLLGPLAADVVHYPLSETLRNQTIGLDAVNLLVVAPAVIAASVLVRRGNALGPVLAVVGGSYTAYMFLQFVVGPDYPHYPGSLPLMMGLFVLGWMVAAIGWTGAVAQTLPAMTPSARSRHSLALLGMAGFVVLRYLPGLPAALSGEGIPAESLADPAMFWSIFLLDLGIFVPLVVVTSVGLRRGADWAVRGLAVAVGWFVLVTLAVLAMSVVMVLRGDPHGAPPQVALFAVTAAAVLTYAARLRRALAVDAGRGLLHRPGAVRSGSRS